MKPPGDRETALVTDTRMPAASDSLQSRSIIGMRVDATSYEDATERVTRWARAGESRYVCVASVNNVMEAYDNPDFSRVMNEADLVTPDGMPLVWGLRRLGVRDASRVYGPNLTPLLLARASEEGIPVGFYGGTPEVLDTFGRRVHERWPDLRVAYAWSPPFRRLTEEEERRVVRDVNESGARVLFVGIGCPKQELFMARHRGEMRAVMVGVGAAFDFMAGTKKQAPNWMQASGTEWIFRLTTEPGRLWRRYLRHNPRFLALFGVQLIRARTERE